VLTDGLGDLDLWVPDGSIDAALDIVSRVALDVGWLEVRRVRRPYASSIYLYMPDGDTSVLAVDLFPSIRWYFTDLIPGELLMGHRQRTGDYWIIHPRSGATATVLHHLAWNRDVPDRYLGWFTDVDDGEDDLPHVATVRRLVSAPRRDWPAIRRQLLWSAAASSIARHPMATLRRSVGLLTSIGTRSHGRWVAFDGTRASEDLLAVQVSLKRNHFLIGRWGSVGEVPTTRARRLWWVLIEVAPKRRLGALLLSSGTHDQLWLHPDICVHSDADGWSISGAEAGSGSVTGTGVTELIIQLVKVLASPNAKRHKLR
jgi:hypothetical protein